PSTRPSETRCATSASSLSWSTDPIKSLRSASTTHHPLSPGLQLLPDFAKGVVGRSPSPVSETGIIEHRLEDRLQSVQQRLLAHSVVDRWNAELAVLPRLACLRNALPPHRLRSIGTGTQFLVQLRKLLFEHLREIVNRLPVNASGAPVRFHALP